MKGNECYESITLSCTCNNLQLLKTVKNCSGVLQIRHTSIQRNKAQ